MKTSTFKYFGLALMAILMVSFTSCEVEIDSFYDDDNNGAGYYNVRLIYVAVPGLVSTATWTVTIAVRNWTSF